MANLAALLSRRRNCSSRAQLILVTAFALAAILLGLAIIVNSAIFTENLATRSENVESTEALEYRQGVTQFTGEVIDFANEHNHTSHETIRDNVTIGIEDTNRYTGVMSSEDGAGLSVTFDDYTDGARIFQDTGDDFANNQSEPDWTLAEDIENTRAFTLNTTEIGPGTFTVVAADSASTDEWRLDIEEDEIEVTHQGETESCDYDVADVDLTSGTVNGETCPALIDTENGEPMQFAAGFDEYDIRFEDGDVIREGNFSLVVDDDDVDTIRDDDYAEIDGPGDGPYVRPAMYSARLGLEYETSRVNYETDVFVAPGEIR